MNHCDEKCMDFADFLKNNCSLVNRDWYKGGKKIRTEDLFEMFANPDEPIYIKPEIEPELSQLLEYVSLSTLISESDLLSDKRGKLRVSDARHLFCFAAREFTSLSFKEIGIFLSGRDHTSVMHAVNKAKDLLKTDRTYKNNYEKVKSLIC